jgi:ApaG protein
VPFTSIPELQGFTASVDEVVYVPGLETTPDRPFAFVYFITITNHSSLPLQVKGRKWIVESADGQTLVVEGDGVVGQKPYLKPGEEFSYNSYHTIGQDSEAHGSFLAVTETGEVVAAKIPRFSMEIP